MNTNAPPPAPPPPPPPPEESYGGFTNTPENNDLPENLAQGRPSVAANPGRVLAVLGVVGLILIVLLYNVFFNDRDRDDEDKEMAQPRTPTQVAPPMAPPETPIITPPPVPEAPRVGIIKPEDDSAARAQLRARLHSSMVLADGTGGGGALGDLFGENEIASTDPNLQFQSQVVRANSKAPRIKATSIGNLHRTIAQGRLIQATLETAINTELPAPIRAIVSRDTFGEAGTEPLIPKGSRLIGQYSTDLSGGQSRVFVVWTRVIRPDGIDVMLGSPLVDQIGQAGIGGQVDNKFQQIFSRAIMASIISIGFAIGVEAVNPSDSEGSSTTSSTFGTTQSGDAASTATVNALNRLGSVTEGFLQRFINARPTILVDQGSPVNVFVNRDLVFPPDLSGPRMVN